MHHTKLRKALGIASAALAMISVDLASAQTQPRKANWEEPARRWQKASDLVGKPVDSTTEPCGKVGDLMVDTESGRIVYGIVNVGGGDNVAVPFTAMMLPDDAAKFRIDAPRDQIKLRAYDKSHQPDFNDRSWAGETYKHFHQEAYWEGRTGGNNVHVAYRYGTRWQKATDLMGKEVKNPGGEKLGRIEDLVIDPDAGRIIYAVLSYGGILGVGDKLFAIPMSSLALSADYKNFVLSVEKERLRNATGFDKKQWPNMADQRWATETSQYYGATPYWQLAAEVETDKSDGMKKDETAKTDRKSTKDGKGAAERRARLATAYMNPAERWQKGSDLVGKSVVENPQGEDCGKIDNLIVDVENGRIIYAVLGLDGKQTVVPFATLYLPSDAVKFMFEGTKQQLQSHMFEKDRLPDFTDKSWAVSIHAAYNQRPYWEAPANDQKGDKAEKSKNTDDKHATASAQMWYHPVARWQKITDVIGMQVKNPQAEDLGKIDDVAIDPDSGRIICSVISFGGFLGMGDKLFAIPCGALTPSGNSKFYVLDVARERLKEAAGFDRSHWPNITDERWMRELHKFYGMPVYWEANHTQDGRTEARRP